MPARSSASQLVSRMHPCNSVLPIFSGDGVPALVRFFVLAFDFVLLSELGPGLGHFDQQCLVDFVRGFAGQAQAFGRAPLVVVEFGHGTLPLRGNAEDCCSVPCICECGQVGPCLPTLLVKIALNAYPYRVPALCEHNPVTGTNRREESGHRERSLSDSEIAKVWLAAPGNDYGNIVKLLLLTGCRREEIGSLKWSEIDFEARTASIAKE